MNPIMVSGEALAQWRSWAKQAAMAADIPDFEVDWFLLYLTPLEPLSLRLGFFKERSQIPLRYSLSELSQLWENRIQERTPVQYLVGFAPWRDFSLKVSPSVLIPRPETELIIDFALKAAENTPNPSLREGHWVDLGTGSGAIAIALADSLPQAKVHAVDSSTVALTIAQENAINTGLSSRIQFYHGSWWTPLHHLKGKVSAMLSNPPYIPTALLSQLQPEVRQHEPLIALDGGVDGLESIQYLIDNSPEYLVSGGIFLMEIMEGQGEQVCKLLSDSSHYHRISVLFDLAGIDRFVLAYSC